MLEGIPPELHSVAAAVLRESPDLLRRVELTQDTFWAGFTPRPDQPELFDEQESFCRNKDLVSFLIGGNAAGTTEAAAWKLAQFVLKEQPPPRPNTPFWIISNSYEQTCGVCWAEKLWGNGHIPDEEVDWARILWHRSTQNWPLAVPLKPWPASRGGNGRNSWTLEFKSYEQGRTAMQARSIGGFWFSEQFPWSLFVEVLRGCRDTMFPGAQFAEFTPIEPDLCVWIEKIMDKPPKGWRFYRANTDCNAKNLKDGWYDSFFGAVPDEMMATRKTGALATFEGVIYPSFNLGVHVVKGRTVIPDGAYHYRAIDWGASEDHPFACVWAYRDAVGDWCVYDEYWSNDQAKITCDHLESVVEKSLDWGWKGVWKAHTKYGPVFAPESDPMRCETYADPSRPGEINEFSGRGVPVMSAMTDVYKGIDQVRTLLKIQPQTMKPKVVIHERCVHLIEEMRKYRWKRARKPTETTTSLLNPQVAAPVPLKRDDDCCDALRYLLYSAGVGHAMKPSRTSHREYVEQRRSIPLVRGHKPLVQYVK